MKTYRGPLADCARGNLAPGPCRWARDPWPVYRTPWPPIRGPSCAGQAPGPCYLVRALVRLVPGARPPILATWWPIRGPRRVRPGGRRPWRVRLVRGTWCAAPGARSGSPGRRCAAPVPAPGPKKCARSMAARASARFYAVSCAPNSFTGPYPGTGMFHVKQSRKQAPFDQLVNSCENFSQSKSKWPYAKFCP